MVPRTNQNSPFGVVGVKKNLPQFYVDVKQQEIYEC